MAGNLRSSRKRALEIGTNPAGFGDPVDYDVRGGHPVTADQPRREYKEQTPAVGGTGEPIQSTPIGGGK